MKITAFFLLIFCLQVSATTLAQNVTLSERHASLEKVINDGDSVERDHSNPAQADHLFRVKLTMAFRGKLTTANV